MIQARNLNLFFGLRQLFADVAFTLDESDRVGLIGLNGSGKSTLLKVLAGKQDLDSGSVTIIRGKKIAYMPQEVVLLSDKSVIQEALAALGGIELEDLAAKEAQAKRVLTGLGFSHQQMGGAVDELSVGWKMRLVLAKLLLQDADFYLFDEPTNHLDIFAKDWFLSFLRESSFGFLLVCHEQYLLNALCEKILELEQGVAMLYSGNYQSYEQLKAAAFERQQAAYVQQQKMITQKKRTIERFRASSTKARMVQSMIRDLEKMERIPAPMVFLKKITFRFPLVHRAGRMVLKVKQVAYAFGEKTIFGNVSFNVEREEKVALVAPNGVGKTTLFNVITGEYPLQKGNVEFGTNVSYAIFHQDPNRSLTLDNTIWDEITKSVCNKSEQEVRKVLGSFLFSGDDIYKKIRVLSGGEKNRVAMAKIFLQDTNFLLLDEPTNHLDMQSKIILLDALQKYPGSILFVSHDHLFLNKLTTRVLELSPQGVTSYQGNYDSYQYQKSQTAFPFHKKLAKKNASKKAGKQLSKKELYELRKKTKRLEEKIDRIEQRAIDLHTQLELHVYGSSTHANITAQLKELMSNKNKSLEQWEDLHKKIDIF